MVYQIKKGLSSNCLEFRLSWNNQIFFFPLVYEVFYLLKFLLFFIGL